MGATQLLDCLDPRAVACLDPADVWRDYLQEHSFLFKGRFECSQDVDMHTIGDECSDLASCETGRAVQPDTQGRRRLQMPRLVPYHVPSPFATGAVRDTMTLMLMRREAGTGARPHHCIAPEDHAGRGGARALSLGVDMRARRCGVGRGPGSHQTQPTLGRCTRGTIRS
jgi:hypothetical protein